MNNIHTPARFYRDGVCKSLSTYQASVSEQNTDEHFHTYLEQIYYHQRTLLINLSTTDSPQEEVHSYRLGVALLALGLLTFGDFTNTLIDDILTELEHARSRQQIFNAQRFISNGLKHLLPLPSNVDPLTHPEGVRTWFSASRSNLQWNETLGKYILQE